MAKITEKMILNFLKTKSNDPSELCTATAQTLYILMGAAIEFSGKNPAVVKESLRVLDEIKNNIIDEFGDGEGEENEED